MCSKSEKRWGFLHAGLIPFGMVSDTDTGAEREGAGLAKSALGGCQLQE